MNESEVSEAKIPENLTAFLDPISGDSPAGVEAATNEDYFKLDMEIGKVTPDYKVCMDLASNILVETSKDLRVASWLCLSWYRVEGLPGLNNGIILIHEFLKTFKEDLHPENPAHRSKAIQFINTSRVVKLIEREKIAKDNAADVIDVAESLQELAAECKTQFPDKSPELDNVIKVLSAHKEEAEELVKTASPPPDEEPEKHPLEKEERPVRAEKPAVAKKAETQAAPEAAIRAKDITFGSEKEVIATLKKAIKFYFQQDEDSKRYEAYIYAISRSLIWNKLSVPSHEDSVTNISAPDTAVVNTFQLWLEENNWDKLVPAIELNFINEDSGFKYWFSGQRYLVTALEQIGGTAQRAADEVVLHLARLLQRHPSLYQLKFDNNMPFADDQTALWIEEQVLTSIGGNTETEMILPPILGEDYDSITEEYKKVCDDLPDNFETNMERLQQAIAGENRRRGRFLRTLNLANFCIQAKKYQLAKVHLSKLLEKIEAYQLAEWEPALCAGVWESMYLVNLKLLKTEKEPELLAEIEDQQGALFYKIGLFNGVLALRLASRNKTKESK